MLPTATAPVVDSSSPFHPYAQAQIEFHARRLSKKPGFSRSDVPDLEQELALDLLQALPKFDPKKASLATFISRVVNRRCLALLRQAGRDQNRRAKSLKAVDTETLTEDRRHRMRDHRPVDDFERTEIAEAVRDAIDALPKDRLKEIALLLMSHTQAEVADILGVSDTTIDRARGKIRAHFDDHGLRDLLRKG